MPKRKDALFYLIIVSIILLGAYLRVLGYHSPSFWLDEAWRANIISSQNWLTELIKNERAPNSLGYILINVFLSRLHNSEPVLRLSSLLPSILSILMVFLISRHLFKTRLITALATFFIAINPSLIEYAKDLKPFSLECLCHLSIIYFFVLYWKYEKYKYLIITFFMCFCSALIAANTAFLFPAVFLLLFYRYFREGNTKMVFITSLMALTVLCTLLSQYVFIWLQSHHDVLVRYWKNEFYPKKLFTAEYLIWVFYKFMACIRHFLNNNTFFEISLLNTLYKNILPVLYFTGIAFLILKRRAEWLTLFLSPILVLLIFNLLNIWPLGPIYVNLFMVIYLSLVMFFALDCIVAATSGRMKAGVIAAITVFFIIFQFPFDFSRYHEKYLLEEIKDAMAYIHDEYNAERREGNKERKNCVRKDILCLSRHSSAAFKYYTQYHHDFSEKYGDFFRNNFSIIHYKGREPDYVERKTKEVISKKKNTWFLLSHYRTYEIDSLREKIGPEKANFPGAAVFYFHSNAKPTIPHKRGGIRSLLHGERDRAQVIKTLRTFDHHGMGPQEFIKNALYLFDIPSVNTPKDILAYYLKKFAMLEANVEPLVPVNRTGGADDVLLNRFSFYGEMHVLRDDIDWEYNPGSGHWCKDLNRFSYLYGLSDSFKETHERKYAEKIFELILDWVKKTDICDAFIPGKSKYVWRCYLNIATHLETWSYVMAEVLPLAPDLISPYDFLRILKSIHDQLQYLHLVITEAKGNWVTIGARCQLTTLAVFPDFKDAEMLAKTAWQRLFDASQMQVLPDGVQFELTPHYHMAVAKNLYTPLLVEEYLPVRAPDSISPTLKKMLYYLRYTVTPDGKHLAFNDSDPDYGESAREFLEKPDVRQIMGSSAESELKSCYFPYSGVVFLRQGSSYKRDELYLAFDCGTFGAGHQHEDKLSFWLSAYGRSFIVDPGRHLYDKTEKSFYSYLKSTKAHSTILIDGQGQNSFSKNETWIPTKPVPLLWDIDDNGIIKAGGCYNLGYGKDNIDIKHKRVITFHPDPGFWIIEDCITGQGIHDIESRFQFAPCILNINNGFICTGFEDSNLAVMVSVEKWHDVCIETGQENPRAGWYSDGYNKIEPAPALVLYALQKKLPFHARTVLFPFRGLQISNRSLMIMERELKKGTF